MCDHYSVFLFLKHDVTAREIRRGDVFAHRPWRAPIVSGGHVGVELLARLNLGLVDRGGSGAGAAHLPPLPRARGRAE